MPKSKLGGVRELVDEFKAQLSIKYRKKNRQGKTNVIGERIVKRQQGRPQPKHP
jgi:hypothetical protein